MWMSCAGVGWLVWPLLREKTVWLLTIADERETILYIPPRVMYSNSPL